MRADFSLQQASSKERHNRLKRVAGVAIGVFTAAGVSLAFSLAMGLQDARWAEAWTGLAQAYSLFSPGDIRA